jgi:membrane-associated phospholipid phosphatase
MPRNVKAPALAAVLCAAAIAPLAAAAYAWGPVKSLDLRIFIHLDRESGSAHDLATVLVSLGDLGPLLVLTALVAALGLWFGRRRELLAALVVIAGANLTTQLLKTTLEHVRHKAFEHGVELPWANSFPSGHTTAAATIAVALLFVVPARHRLKAAIAGLLLVAAVGSAVVVLGWHYPSDVLGGLLVVGTWGFGALAVLRAREGHGRAVSGRRRPTAATAAIPTPTE